MARLRNPKTSYALMLIPVLALIGFLFVYPMVDMVARSLGSTQGTCGTKALARSSAASIVSRQSKWPRAARHEVNDIFSL